MSGIHFHGHAHAQPHAHLSSDVPAWIAGADARVKLLTALAMVVIAVSTPPESFMAVACYFSTFGLLAIWSRISPHVVLTRLAAVVPFVAFIALFVPFLPDPSGAAAGFGAGALRVHRAGLVVFWNVLWKATFGVLTLSLLTWTTPFERILRALEELRTPPVLVMLTSFTYRYAFVLADEVVRMRRARDSRGWEGRTLAQARTIGQMIGMLFLRSYERAERIHLAMLARGYEGRPPRGASEPLRWLDPVVALGLLALLLVFRLGVR